MDHSSLEIHYQTPPPSLRFKTGTSTFKLTSSSLNEDPDVGSELISSASKYITSGKVNTIKSTNVTVRVPPPVYYNYMVVVDKNILSQMDSTWDGNKILSIL